MFASLAATLSMLSPAAVDVLPMPETVLQPEPIELIAAADDVASPSAGSMLSIGLVYEDVDLGEIRWEGGISGNTITFQKASRQRVGLQIERHSLFARVYQAKSYNGLFEGFGFGAGGGGAREIGHLGGPAKAVIDFKLGFDLEFVDSSELNASMFTGDLSGRIGAGVQYQSLTFSVGLAGDLAFGSVSIPQTEDISVSGTNSGFYLGVGYHPNTNVPVRARIDVFSGDIDGVALSAGFAF